MPYGFYIEIFFTCLRVLQIRLSRVRRRVGKGFTEETKHFAEGLAESSANGIQRTEKTIPKITKII